MIDGPLSKRNRVPQFGLQTWFGQIYDHSCVLGIFGPCIKTVFCSFSAPFVRNLSRLIQSYGSYFICLCSCTWRPKRFGPALWLGLFKFCGGGAQ